MDLTKVTFMRSVIVSPATDLLFLLMQQRHNDIRRRSLLCQIVGSLWISCWTWQRRASWK